MSFREIARVSLLGIVPTGNVIHSTEEGILPAPYALSIVQYNDDSGYYLFYLDKDGIEQTDTYHEHLYLAFEQAEFEFGIKPDSWMFAK